MHFFFWSYFIAYSQASRKQRLSNSSECDLIRHNIYIMSPRVTLMKQRLSLQKNNLTSIYVVVARKKLLGMLLFFVCMVLHAVYTHDGYSIFSWNRLFLQRSFSASFPYFYWWKYLKTDESLKSVSYSLTSTNSS